MTTTETPKTAQHTPGPWTAHQGWADKFIDPNVNDEYPNWCEVTGPEALTICGHFGIVNARLIAAAPELYEAASEAYDELEGLYDGAPDSPTRHLGMLVEKLKAAIAKAEGN